MGFKYNLIEDDVVKLDTSTGQVEVFRDDKLVRKLYVDGALLKIHSGKNDFMFVTDVEDPILELFDCDIDVTEST